VHSTQPSEMVVVLPVDPGQAHKEQNLIIRYECLVYVGEISMLY